MNQFLLHFFPLLTIFLFLLAAVFFFQYMNSIRKIEKHMESNRSEEWEDLGKPSVLSGKYSEKNIQFRELLEEESEDEQGDAEMATMWETSKKLKSMMTRTTWTAFGMYFFTIVAVRILLDRISGV